MGKLNLSLFSLAIILITMVSSRDTSMLGAQKPHQIYSYCIALENSTDTKLQGIIARYCQRPRIDCNLIKPEGICFQPNNLYAHASVVLDLFFQAEGTCPLFDGHVQYVDRPAQACPYYPGPP